MFLSKGFMELDLSTHSRIATDEGAEVNTQLPCESLIMQISANTTATEILITECKMKTDTNCKCTLPLLLLF